MAPTFGLPTGLFPLSDIDSLINICYQKSRPRGRLPGQGLRPELNLRQREARSSLKPEARQMSHLSHHNHAHKLSALDEIDATIQPIGAEPALRAKVDQLVKLNDVGALVALYDAFAAAAVAFQSILNRPIARDVEMILEEESANAWSKAFFVADRLKTLRCVYRKPYPY